MFPNQHNVASGHTRVWQRLLAGIRDRTGVPVGSREGIGQPDGTRTIEPTAAQTLIWVHPHAKQDTHFVSQERASACPSSPSQGQRIHSPPDEPRPPPHRSGGPPAATADPRKDWEVWHPVPCRPLVAEGQPVRTRRADGPGWKRKTLLSHRRVYNGHHAAPRVSSHDARREPATIFDQPERLCRTRPGHRPRRRTAHRGPCARGRAIFAFDILSGGHATHGSSPTRRNRTTNRVTVTSAPH